MRRFLPESGVMYLEIHRPEDQALYTECSTAIQNELKKDIPANDFVVRLMKHYMMSHKQSRPML